MPREVPHCTPNLKTAWPRGGGTRTVLVRGAWGLGARPPRYRCVGPGPTSSPALCRVPTHAGLAAGSRRPGAVQAARVRALRLPGPVPWGGGRGVYNNPSVPQGRGRWPGTPRPSPPHRVDSVCPSRLGLASPLTHILLEWAEAALGRGHPSPFLPGTLWSQTRLFCREASIPVLGAACPKLAGACEVPAWKRPPPQHSCVRRRVCAPDPRNSPTISGLWPWRAG